MRPMENAAAAVRYVSNKIISSLDDPDDNWYVPRLSRDVYKRQVWRMPEPGELDNSREESWQQTAQLRILLSGKRMLIANWHEPVSYTHLISGTVYGVVSGESGTGASN